MRKKMRVCCKKRKDKASGPTRQLKADAEADARRLQAAQAISKEEVHRVAAQLQEDAASAGSAREKAAAFKEVVAWHLATSTFTLCGWRGAYGAQLGRVMRLVAFGAASFCVAGVALGDMELRFVWQAWRLAASTFTLCGWRGTCGAQLGRVTRLVAFGAASFCVAGVALGDMELRFVWHAWHLVTWTFTLCGGLRFVWQAWHLARSSLMPLQRNIVAAEINTIVFHLQYWARASLRARTGRSRLCAPVLGADFRTRNHFDLHKGPSSSRTSCWSIPGCFWHEWLGRRMVKRVNWPKSLTKDLVSTRGFFLVKSCFRAPDGAPRCFGSWLCGLVFDFGLSDDFHVEVRC
eukprot:s386_g33.t1